MTICHQLPRRTPIRLFRQSVQALGTILLLVLLPAAARAQDVFSGGDTPPTYSDQFSTSCEQGQPPNVYKQVGMNPLVCKGVVAPPDSRGGCTLGGNLQLIQKVGNTCVYCSPIDPPINGILIPYDQVSQATGQGFRCGVDQVDPKCMAICSKPGSTAYRPPPSGGNTGGRTRGQPIPGGIASDPCHPYYDMSTPAGRAAAQRNAARDKAACDQERCKHNPQLEVCSNPTYTGGGTSSPAPPADTTCHVKGTLAEFGNVAVSLDEYVHFRARSSQNIPADWWDTTVNMGMNGRYPTVHDSRGKIVSNFRYVKVPGHPDAVIDMRHFEFVGPMGQEFGCAVEALQGMAHQASAYQRQDFFSNALGENFRNFALSHLGSTYTQALSDFFGPGNSATVNRIISDANALQ